MSKNFLICSPIKKSWPNDKKNNLFFVSESSILSFKGSHDEYAAYSINESRWLNKKIFSKDFSFLIKIYEKYLILISKELNKYHKTNYSLRFWRILIGPWLSTFIHIYFDRWQNVKSTVKKNKIDKCIFLNFDLDLFVPYDHKNFIYFSQNDLWNQFLYQKIVKVFLKKNKIKHKNISNQKITKELKDSILNKFYKKDDKANFKSKIMQSFNYANRKNYKIFLYSTYLGFKNEFKLALKMKQMPIFLIQENKSIKKKTDAKIRLKLSNIGLKKNSFEKNLLEVMGIIFPKIFLENFLDLDIFSKTANIPQNPKIIFTSNSLWYNTKISYHVANLIDKKKSKLVQGQHGGAMGLVKHHWPEMHEIKISDYFLSWGWNKRENKKIKKFFILKKLEEYNDKRKSLLVPLKPRKRYFHSLESSSGTESYRLYIRNVNLFLIRLNKQIINKTILRLPFKNLDVKDIDFYSDLNSKYNFYSKDSFNEACEKSKLIIHASNSTPLLETLSANIPTILILDKHQHPVRSDCKKYFELLNENNIIFYKSDLAASFVNKIWNSNIESWWNSTKTQKAVKLFTENFARKNYDIVKECYDFLKKI